MNEKWLNSPSNENFYKSNFVNFGIESQKYQLYQSTIDMLSFFRVYLKKIPILQNLISIIHKPMLKYGY